MLGIKEPRSGVRPRCGVRGVWASQCRCKYMYLSASANISVRIKPMLHVNPGQGKSSKVMKASGHKTPQPCACNRWHVCNATTWAKCANASITVGKSSSAWWAGAKGDIQRYMYRQLPHWCNEPLSRIFINQGASVSECVQQPSHPRKNQEVKHLWRSIQRSMPPFEWVLYCSLNSLS